MKRASFDITTIPACRVWRVGRWAYVGSAARALGDQRVLIRAEALFCVESGRGWVFDAPRAVEVRVDRWRWRELLREEELHAAFGGWRWDGVDVYDTVSVSGDDALVF